MKRKIRFAHAFLLGWVLSAVSLMADSRPNILFINTDDQRPDSLQCFNLATTGKPESALGYVLSPNVDQLAAQGTMFTQAYCQAPICGPSRASFNRGAYNHHVGNYGYESGHNGNDNYIPMIGERLSEMGYFTAMFGKGEHSTKQFPKNSWDMGFDVTVGPLNNRVNVWGQGGTGLLKEVTLMESGPFAGTALIRDNNKSPYYAPSLENPSVADADEVFATTELLNNSPLANFPQVIGGRDPEDEADLSDTRIADAIESFLLASLGAPAVIDTLDDNIGADPATFNALTLEQQIQYVKDNSSGTQSLTGPDPSKPLYLECGFHFPHTPVLPPQSFRNLFTNEQYAIPAFSNEIDLALLPPRVDRLLNSFKVEGLNPEQLQQMVQDYYAFCAFGDSVAGRVIEDFKAHSDRTGRPWVIVFMVGDHSWHLGEQGYVWKGGPWAKSTHGSLIVASSDNRFPRNQITDTMVEYIDVAPTIYAAAGADLSDPSFDNIDGLDLEAVIKDPELRRDYIIGEMDHGGPWAHLRSRDFAFSFKHRPVSSAVLDRDWNNYLVPGPGLDIRWGLDAPREDVEMILYDLRVDPGERCNVANHPRYLELADWFRDKLGHIVLGDGRVEVDWLQQNDYSFDNFAPGARTLKLNLPEGIVPEPRPLTEESVATLTMIDFSTAAGYSDGNLNAQPSGGTYFWDVDWDAGDWDVVSETVQITSDTANYRTTRWTEAFGGTRISQSANLTFTRTNETIAANADLFNLAITEQSAVGGKAASVGIRQTPGSDVYALRFYENVGPQSGGNSPTFNGSALGLTAGGEDTTDVLTLTLTHTYEGGDSWTTTARLSNGATVVASLSKTWSAAGGPAGWSDADKYLQLSAATINDTAGVTVNFNQVSIIELMSSDDELTAYALGVDTFASLTEALPGISISAGAVDFQAPWTLADDIDYIVEVSEDLSTWYRIAHKLAGADWQKDETDDETPVFPGIGTFGVATSGDGVVITDTAPRPKLFTRWRVELVNPE